MRRTYKQRKGAKLDSMKLSPNSKKISKLDSSLESGLCKSSKVPDKSKEEILLEEEIELNLILTR